MRRDPVLRSRQLALEAMIRAGGTARLAQIEHAGLVVRASSLAPIAPPATSPGLAGDVACPGRFDVSGSLLSAYCSRVGCAVPSRFRAPEHLSAMALRMHHGRRG
jgi:hypothetical protein